eukprot:2549182-Lingulodinium_polyedra.AAC.1
MRYAYEVARALDRAGNPWMDRTPCHELGLVPARVPGVRDLWQHHGHRPLPVRRAVVEAHAVVARAWVGHSAGAANAASGRRVARSPTYPKQA